MSDNTNLTQETEDIFSGAKQDTNIDVASLIATKKEDIPNVQAVEPATTAGADTSNLSPLEKLKLQKETQTAGMIVTNDELEAGRDKGPTKNLRDDILVREITDTMKDLDDSLEKRKKVVIVKPLLKPEDVTRAMLEIDSLTLNEETGAYEFNLGVDPDGNKIIPSYCRLRTEADGALDMEKVKARMETGATGPVAEKTETDSGESNMTEEERELQSQSFVDHDTQRDKIVSILIDKTGCGAELNFTDEEKKKISEAKIIKLTEVEFVDAEAFEANSTVTSFSNAVEEYGLGSSKCKAYFPASGFSAELRGLSYGELADIALSVDTTDVDQNYKRLTVIYNSMTSISVGPFENFEDFLHKFAFVDIPIALWALFVATYPEVQSITLNCGNCKRDFTINYQPRALFKIDQCADTFIQKMEELVDIDLVDVDRVFNNSVVQKSKFLRLPTSKTVVEMGVISAYEYLYTFLPIADEDTFKNTFGDDPNNVYASNLLLLMAVRSVSIPNGKGGYAKFVGYKDILEALYRVRPEEVKIIAEYTAKYIHDYSAVFSFGDVVCTHEDCHQKTENMQVTMDELVFQTYQQLMDTSVNLENELG